MALVAALLLAGMLARTQPGGWRPHRGGPAAPPASAGDARPAAGKTPRTITHGHDSSGRLHLPAKN